MVAEQTPAALTGKKVATKPQRGPTARQCQFAQFVATGTNQAEAYRKVFNPNLKNQIAAMRGSRMAALPWVNREIHRIRAKSEARKLLTLNERLAILAEGAQDPDATWGERAACIREYGRQSGDMAPERKEISGPAGGPIQVQSEAPVNEVLRLTVEDRIALFDQRRASEAAASAGAGRN